MEFSYHIHGLRIQSDLCLLDTPSLIHPTNTPSLCDVRIFDHAPEIDWATQDNIQTFGYFRFKADGSFFCEIPDLASMWVTGGNSIHIHSRNQSKKSDIGTYVLGTGLGAILHQRGLVNLHGNALLTNQGALLCLGESGAGKSTLSAALTGMSCSLLADDLVAFDHHGLAQRGLPRIKLWRNSLDLLALSTEGLDRVLQKEEKFILPQNQQGTQTAPIHLVVILENRPGHELEFSELTGPIKLLAIFQHVYRREFIGRLSSPGAILKKIVEIFSSTKVVRATRDANIIHPHEFAGKILQQFA